MSRVEKHEIEERTPYPFDMGTRYLKEIGGVYAITHAPTNSIYIGSSRNVVSRWRGHRTKLRSGRHVNPDLQADFCRFPESEFTFTILETTQLHPTPIEQRYTAEYSLDRNIRLYNRIACKELATRMEKEQQEKQSSHPVFVNLSWGEWNARMAFKEGMPKAERYLHLMAAIDQLQATVDALKAEREGQGDDG
jgi:GIY-YIG catalytic domain